jgi:hypothetical protein
MSLSAGRLVVSGVMGNLPQCDEECLASVKFLLISECLF